MPTRKDAKTLAKSLRVALADRNVPLSHSECLEIVARQLGFADWNTHSAKLPIDAGRLARSQGPAVPPPAIVARISNPVTESVSVTPSNDVEICSGMDETSQITRIAVPEQLSCSFCGKSQHDVRSLIEGGCSPPRRTPESCIFICDECVAFCAQINADTVGNAVPCDRSEMT